MTNEQRTRVAVVGTEPWWGREHALLGEAEARSLFFAINFNHRLLQAFGNQRPPPIHARAHAIIHSFQTGSRTDVPPDTDTSGR